MRKYLILDKTEKSNAKDIWYLIKTEKSNAKDIWYLIKRKRVMRKISDMLYFSNIFNIYLSYTDLFNTTVRILYLFCCPLVNLPPFDSEFREFLLCIFDF